MGDQSALYVIQGCYYIPVMKELRKLRTILRTIRKASAAKDGLWNPFNMNEVFCFESY